MTTPPGGILHETRHRLRVAAAPPADPAELAADLAGLPGVRSVRANATLRSVAVQHDGRAETRAAILQRLHDAAPSAHHGGGTRRPTAAAAGAAAWAPAVLAVAMPALPRDWRPAAALGVVATRVLTQPGRLRSDPAAVLLDAASLTSLAVSGQPLVVSTSVLLRLLSERLSARLVHEADALLGQLLPSEAATCTARRDDPHDPGWAAWPVAALRPGDRLRLLPGELAPVDGCVVDGEAVLAPATRPLRQRRVAAGDHVAAGERLQAGRLELHAEADAAGSRLARLRAQVQHAIGSRDPVGRLAPGLERMLSLPLTASALVLGLTGDTARAASMLQADPQQGLDLALPLAREAALYALARAGLLTGGLEAIERLATARTLVLQDTGVLASGRWTVEAVHTEAGGDAGRVRGWLAALAGLPVDVLDRASVPDRLVRQWVRHGAVLRVGEHELHLAGRQRLQQVWGLEPHAAAAPAAGGPLRRRLAVVAAGRVVATVVLASALRPAASARLRELAAAGFERIAVFVEADGSTDVGAAAGQAPVATRPTAPERIADEPAGRAAWLADAARDGLPLVMVHTVLRDLVPPGSLSLTPTDADAGSHGVLLGDPLASLVAARRVAQQVHRRLRLQQAAANAGNAALMTAAALRWLPPIGTTLLHHGLALLLLLDSLRIESVRAPPDAPPAPFPPRGTAARPRPGAPDIDTTRSESA